MGNTRHCQYQPLLLCLILSILVDTFFTRISMPKQHPGIHNSLPLDHRRKLLIGRVYSPVVPITDEISPDEGFQFLYCHFFCVMPSIDEFFPSTGPTCSRNGHCHGIVLPYCSYFEECRIYEPLYDRFRWCTVFHGLNGSQLPGAPDRTGQRSQASVCTAPLSCSHPLPGRVLRRQNSQIWQAHRVFRLLP